ncbi:unnamed protein product, partial [Staurois parvus]
MSCQSAPGTLIGERSSSMPTSAASSVIPISAASSV